MLHSNNSTATPLLVLQSTSDSDRPPRAFRGTFIAKVDTFPFHLCSRPAFQELPGHVRTKGELQNRISRFSNYRSRMRTAGEGGLSLVFASRAAVPHPASARNLPQRRTELMPSRLFSSARHNCSREATAETGARIQILPNWMRTAGEGGLSLVFASRAAVPHPASARNLPQRRTELTPSKLFPSARHNCNREATVETGGRIANPAELSQDGKSCRTKKQNKQPAKA